jgi:hypothetical protein
MAFDGREDLFALGADNSILDYRHPGSGLDPTNVVTRGRVN